MPPCTSRTPLPRLALGALAAATVGIAIAQPAAAPRDEALLAAAQAAQPAVIETLRQLGPVHTTEVTA